MKINMKKIYQNPEIKVIKIDSYQMICESGVLDKNQTITNSSNFGSREGNFFDDDEDY